MVMKTKNCIECKASFIPDDDEEICMFCFVKKRDSNSEKSLSKKIHNKKCESRRLKNG